MALETYTCTCGVQFEDSLFRISSECDECRDAVLAARQPTTPPMYFDMAPDPVQIHNMDIRAEAQEAWNARIQGGAALAQAQQRFYEQQGMVNQQVANVGWNAGPTYNWYETIVNSVTPIQENNER